jgi:hypothetical protein
MNMVDKGELINIHRPSIAGFNPRSAALNTGTTLNCDAVVFETRGERT